MKRHLLSAVLFSVLSLSATAGLLPPQVGLGWRDGWVETWRTDVPGLDVRDTTVRIASNLVKVVRRWTWRGQKPLDEVVLSVRYRLTGDPTDLKPFLPGVLLYGNPSNKGRTDGRVPVYAGEPGEFAQFEEHRLPMPFALLESAKTGAFAAVHTLPSPLRGARREDLWWSLGVEAGAGEADIVLLSGPIGYNRRRSVAKAQQTTALSYDEAYVTLFPNQVVEKTFWIQEGRASRTSFGFQQALTVSLDLFRPYDTTRLTPFDEIVRSKRAYALTRWIDEPKTGACGFNMYEERHRRRHFTLGWCGCAATCGYALPVLDAAAADWQKAQRSLDFISTTFLPSVPTQGVFRVTYDVATGRLSGGDPVSCGQALYSIVKAIRFAERHRDRLDPSKWRVFARTAADALARNVLSTDWREPKSTADGFLIAPLVVASELFHDVRHLAAAIRLAETFDRRYRSYAAVYWGGTLDASCEDKEGSYAAFQGYWELLRHARDTGDRAAEKRWATSARHAMDMMLTYTMIWDATYPPGRLSDHAFKSTGWTVVSAQNQHLDAFGVLTTPEIWKMGAYLGDRRLQDLARVMFRSCFQLTDASGALGEQIQQTNFGQQGKTTEVSSLRGGYSESWTVFWLTAHFLNAAAQFREMGVEP